MLFCFIYLLETTTTSEDGVGGRDAGPESEVISTSPGVNRYLRLGAIGKLEKKLSYRRVTARCVLSVVILPITTQQYRNYLYDKS